MVHDCLTSLLYGNSFSGRISIQPFCQFLYQYSYCHNYCYSSKISCTDVHALQGGNAGPCLLLPSKHPSISQKAESFECFWSCRLDFQNWMLRTTTKNTEQAGMEQNSFFGLTLITVHFFEVERFLPSPAWCRTSHEHCGFLFVLSAFCPPVPGKCCTSPARQLEKPICMKRWRDVAAEQRHLGEGLLCPQGQEPFAP